MTTKIKAPKGWRVLGDGNILKPSDLRIPRLPSPGPYSRLKNYAPTKLAGERIGDNPSTTSGVYIRRIKKGKK